MAASQFVFAILLLLLLAGGVFILVNSSRVMRAVFLRNVLSYFSGLLGYLFIVAFVTAAGILAFPMQFFTDNQLNLDHLSQWYPLLLLFIVPAITMSAWSDERKLGTDEILFTLPARDWEILAGKYLAVLAVYTISLGFSLLLWVWYAWLGTPDWGSMFSTYFGYWLAGAALLSAGMFASSLTNSATVAYVLGAILCAVPVFIGWAAPSSDFLQGFTLAERLRDFNMGTIPLTGVLYFVSFTAFMLYLNLVVISRRHWSANREAEMGIQFTIRTFALLAALIGLNVMATHAAARADMTKARLFTLTPATSEIIARIPADRPVEIQAFISPRVPHEYLPTQKQLLGLLREFGRLGGSRVNVRIVDIEPFSVESDEAKSYGILPETVQTEVDGKFSAEHVFMGARISSATDEVVVPVFRPGTPIEYELTRSVRTVSKDKRLTVGVLTTDARVMGMSNEWRIVKELKQQYNVEEVSPDSAIDEKKYDVLIAVLPSSLTAPQLNNLVDYVKKGRPTLLFDDPFPLSIGGGFGATSCPRQQKPKPGGMFGGMGGPPPEPKADEGKLTPLLKELNLAWDNGEIAWDSFNPHPRYESAPKEYLFITPKNGVKTAISPDSDITSGLQEVLFFYAGTLRPRSDSDYNFEPLFRTSKENSGLLEWDEYSTDSFGGMGMGMQMTRVPKPSPPHVPGNTAHVLAYHITSKKEKGVNVVFVADVDCISDTFFQLRERNDAQLNFDNIIFVLNAVDVLAGDKSFLDLRKRRPELRTIEAFERRTKQYETDRRKREKDADDEAKAAVEKAKERFKKERDRIDADKTIDEQTKQIMIRTVQQTEERRIKVESEVIDRDKQEKVEKIKNDMQRNVRAEVNRLRAMSIATLPLPAFILGAIFLILRWQAETSHIKSERLVKKP